MKHLLAAGGYSVGGMRRLWRETAFRHEVLAGAAALALLLWARATLAELLGFAVLFLVLIATEALNTAVEEIVDRLSPDWSDMARNAKDLGSLAVLCLLGANGLYLAAVLLN
jgi:diacylglycerol kinase (ATP)